MRSIRFTLLTVTFAFIAGATLADDSACTAKGRVSIHAKDLPIRTVLQEMYAQSKMNLALDPHIKGPVSANFDCMTIEEALDLVLPQVAAEFCASDDVIRIGREGRLKCAHPSPIIEHVRNTDIKSR